MKSSKDESDDNALNLSRKSSRTSTPSRESNSSSIVDGLSIKSDIVSKTLQKDSLASQFLSNLKSRSLLVNSDKADLRYLQRYPPTTLSSLQHILSIPPLHPLTDHANLPPTSTNSKLVRTDAPSPTSYSHSEYNSDDALVIDDGSGKPISKRPWPHVCIPCFFFIFACSSLASHAYCQPCPLHGSQLIDFDGNELANHQTRAGCLCAITGPESNDKPQGCARFGSKTPCCRSGGQQLFSTVSRIQILYMRQI